MSDENKSAQAAIERAILYDNQLDAINWIVTWEHERSLTNFLNTGNRETCFRWLIGQVIMKHTQRTLLRAASPWPTHTDDGVKIVQVAPEPPVKPQLPETHPMLGGGQG